MAFSSAVTFAAWQPASWLRVTGADAADFLQGQFTQDLRGLGDAGARYGLWLSVKGKVLADGFVVRGTAAGEFWLGSYFSPAAAVRARLEPYIIADDVVIEDCTSDWSAVSLWGATRADFEAAGNNDDVAALADAVIFPGRRGAEPNLECVFPAANVQAVRMKLGAASEIDAAEVERRRIRAGIPAVPRDIGPDDLPNEAGLETDAISYTKGCYLGQEVMARLKSMGRVRRRLVRVAGAVPAGLAMPARLFVGEREVGDLRSAAREPDGTGVGFALLSRIHVTPDVRLAFAAGGEPALRLIDAP